MTGHNPTLTLSYRARIAEAHSKPNVVARNTPARMVTSDTILRGEHEIGIEHHGAMYRLKVTRQGKLILNK